MMAKINLMTHVVAGYPSMEECEELVVVMDKAGVAYVEVQFPFSDPIADGPTLMRANDEALKNGVMVEACFELMERLQARVKVPLLIMTYYNVVFRYGVEEFCKRAAGLGIYGFIVPDIPIDEEEREGYLAMCEQYGLQAIQVVSPLTSDERLVEIGKVASGFVYCVARKGITGAQGDMDSGLEEYLGRVRQHVKLPLALGFGISSKEQVEQACEVADMAVMGSHLINLYRDADDGVKSVEVFLSGLTK
jgi:tryptophan synthase alpha chain